MKTPEASFLPDYKGLFPLLFYFIIFCHHHLAPAYPLPLPPTSLSARVTTLLSMPMRSFSSYFFSQSLHHLQHPHFPLFLNIIILSGRNHESQLLCVYLTKKLPSTISKNASKISVLSILFHINIWKSIKIHQVYIYFLRKLRVPQHQALTETRNNGNPLSASGVGNFVQRICKNLLASESQGPVLKFFWHVFPHD